MATQAAISHANGAPAAAAHEDPATAAAEQWIEWVIPLQPFPEQGINRSNVDSIAIGFGTQSGMASPGGLGTVHFDDMRLYP